MSETNVNSVKDSENSEHEESKKIEIESPINLTISKMTVVNLNPLIWFNYQMIPHNLKIMNTGKTVIVGGMWERVNHPFLTGGPLRGNYFLSQFHFHWGPNEMTGSEHFIDNSSQPMELHALHLNSKYESQDIARRKEDGVIIVVYMFKLQSLKNEAFDTLLQHFPNIEKPNYEVLVKPVSIDNFLRPFVQNYFFYNGFLSDIFERYEIMWLISREPIGISMEQVGEFRKLKDINLQPILDNCRPLKSQGDRNQIFHVNPSGSTHSSLLPIPRD